MVTLFVKANDFSNIGKMKFISSVKQEELYDLKKYIAYFQWINWVISTVLVN